MAKDCERISGVHQDTRRELGCRRRFGAYEYRRLRLLARYCRGQNVLDLGYADLPNPYLSGFYRVGVDLKQPNDHMLQVSASRYDEHIVADVRELTGTLSDRTFDNIIAGELIEHLENPYEFLRSIRSLLSPSGRLILSTPNPLAFPVLLFEFIRSKRCYYTQNHLFYFCPRWLERMLQVSGYGLLATRGVGLWNPLIPLPCPVSLSYQVIYVGTPV